MSNTRNKKKKIHPVVFYMLALVPYVVPPNLKVATDIDLTVSFTWLFIWGAILAFAVANWNTGGKIIPIHMGISFLSFLGIDYTYNNGLVDWPPFVMVIEGILFVLFNWFLIWNFKLDVFEKKEEVKTE